jgi:GT2 family glycosyltransferase
MLVGCLRSLGAQKHPPLEVLVCFREGDTDTAQTIASLDGPEQVVVRSVVLGPDDNFAAGLRAGIAASRGDLVAFTDDDSEAPPDWLARIVGFFEDESVAGVGGRDVLSFETPPSPVVGRMQWFGRIIGNHHAGQGGTRDVDFLKGVNCCFRGDLVRAVGIDPRLRGAGNVVHTELSVCLPLRRAGWRLVYDPSLTVNHHAAPRKDGDDNHRGGFSAAALQDMVHNETVMVLEHLSPAGKLAFALWSFGVGSGHAQGIAKSLHSALTGKASASIAAKRWWSTLNGRLKGWRTYIQRQSKASKLQHPTH